VIRSRLAILAVFILSILMISYGFLSERETKKPRTILPIAASIVDGNTYVYGFVGDSHYKVSVEIPPEQYVIAMSGEPLTVSLSDNQIRRPDTRWEDISLIFGVVLLFLTIIFLGVPYDDSKSHFDT